ncbi:copper chaperone PCu(A)C [Halomonas urumqiensis]|uniref:Copper chaperone PCu(A)C n=1 Tax=Halomonas urumqiensis TaxID=1684789 RepID=A0A2N7UJN1_9GAMM|nr:copper chaperone PCu(A)C [Halomonas urumqiensis]PMR80620.1 hypothetical protein C1H70_08070 [Halomonas urumqiensis]PTB02693.1 copper chaperone PCu(A)C [Halomonas urumqiensis]GHE21190.1 hypothetical protein GCM10017767_17110 [Halomonas urumqiensis]
MHIKSLLPLAAGLTFAASTMAHDYQLGDIRIAHPFATPAPPGVPHAAAYLDISVAGDEPAVLVGASTPASDSVELHNMSMDDGVMSMRRVEQIDVPAGTTETMRPGGGYHLMMFELTGALAEGDSFPMTLEFAEHGEIKVEVWVQNAEEGKDAADGHHDH